MNEKIKEQLRDIDDQIEVIGKICDNQYKKSYNMLKNILDKESEKIDTGIKNYISNLREQLVNFKTRLNFDYKGEYNEISKRLNNTVEKLKKNNEEKSELENKFNVLNEDEQFYERQLDNLKDMNIYLKYKLKLLLKDYDALNNYNLGYNQNQEEGNEYNIEDNEDNEEPSNENNPQNNVVQHHADNYFITGLNEYEERDDSPNNNINDNNYNQENGYNLNNKPNAKFSDDQIQKVYSRLNYIRGKLYNNIENENIEYSNLKQVFDKLYYKTNNIYMNILKNTHNEQKLNNSSTTGNNNNSSMTNNNQSTLPSIYQSTNSSRNASKRSYKPKEGYMTKKQNKDLIIKFLENDEIKKIIYKMLYDD
jgi:hypothetical protein